MIRKIKGILSGDVKVEFLSHRLMRMFSLTKPDESLPLISKLQNRSLLILHGPETYKLLQGLTTNDINLLSNKNLKANQTVGPSSKSFSQRVCLYTLFLSPKGKLITDAFIYKPKEYLNGNKRSRQDQLWIDVDSGLKKELFFHLKKYLWKKQVQLIDVEKQNDSHKPSIFVGFNHISTISSPIDRGVEIEMKNSQYREEEYANLMMFDPRGGNYGRRILCMQEQLGLPPNSFKFVSQKQYQDFQRTIGFTPSTLSTGKLPFQFNFDLLNAISFKKGCYLGQQIVSRSYFTGIVRRRVFPFLVNNESSLKPEQIAKITEGTKLMNESNQQIGKVIFYEKGSTGLALAPYLHYFNEQQLDQIIDEKRGTQMLNIPIKAPFEGILYCPFQGDLTNYITQTRKKQKNLEQIDI